MGNFHLRPSRDAATGGCAGRGAKRRRTTATAGHQPPPVHASRLLELPAELWELVAKGLTPHDLACLSLASRQGHAVAHSITSLLATASARLAACEIRDGRGGTPAARQLHDWAPTATEAGVSAWSHILFRHDVFRQPGTHGDASHGAEAPGGAPAPGWACASNVVSSVRHTQRRPLPGGTAEALRAVAGLPNVHTVNLSGSDVNNAGAALLGRVPCVNLSGCSKLTGVAALAGCLSIDLAHCANLRDVSALGNARKLNLRHCPRVTNAAALGRVGVLDLSSTGVVDVAALANVYVWPPCPPRGPPPAARHSCEGTR